MHKKCQVIAYNKISYSGHDFCKLLANVKENLSQLVQRRLKELGASKAEIARQTGLSRTYITDIANNTGNTQSGQYNLTPGTVGKLSKALVVSESEILEAMSYLTIPKNDIPKPILNALAREGKMFDDDVYLVAQMIETMKKRNDAKNK